MERKHLFDDPANVRKLLGGFFVLCGLLLLVDLVDLAGRLLGVETLAFKARRHYGAEGWFGFYGVYGFVGCVLLVIAAKGLRRLVMREEDYYDR